MNSQERFEIALTATGLVIIVAAFLGGLFMGWLAWGM